MIKVDQMLQSIHGTYDHIIDFDKAKIVDKGKIRCRLTLESRPTKGVTLGRLSLIL